MPTGSARFDPDTEAIWDYVVGKLLRVPVPGVRLDRMMIVAIPLEVAEQLDADLSTFVDDPQIDEDETELLRDPSDSRAASDLVRRRDPSRQSGRRR